MTRNLLILTLLAAGAVAGGARAETLDGDHVSVDVSGLPQAKAEARLKAAAHQVCNTGSVADFYSADQCYLAASANALKTYHQRLQKTAALSQAVASR
jgi:UrcA family protein